METRSLKDGAIIPLEQETLFVLFFPLHLKGAFLVKDDRVLKGPLGRSLCSITRTSHSAHSPRSALLRLLASFTGSLTHFAHSLVGQLK